VCLILFNEYGCGLIQNKLFLNCRKLWNDHFHGEANFCFKEPTKFAKKQRLTNISYNLILRVRRVCFLIEAGTLGGTLS